MQGEVKKDDTNFKIIDKRSPETQARKAGGDHIGERNEIVLKPCGHCGEEAVLREYFDGYENTLVHWVVCPACWISTKRYASKRQAIAAWNRRTPEPATPLFAVDPSNGHISVVSEPETSVIRWTRYDGTPETLPEKNHVQVLFFRKGDLQGSYFYHKFGEHIELLSCGEQIIPKKGDLWAYLPQPPEGI